jgi:hypothetical protein
VDGWELESDPFVDKGHGRDTAIGRGLRMERDKKRMRTSSGMGVYGIDATRRVGAKELEPEGKARMVEGGWDVVGDGDDEEDDWEGKWGEEEDATTPMGANSNSNTHADVETWRRHWEEVERSFSPRRGGGRRLGLGQRGRGLDEG